MPTASRMARTATATATAAMVEAAAQANEPLAGHAASDWLAWGTVFTELQRWLQTPIDGVTPMQVLMKRYVAQEVQQ